jgi:hypothetical protein
MKFLTSIFLAIIFLAVFSSAADAQLCGTFGVTLNVYDNDMKPVDGATVRIVPWARDELSGDKFAPVAGTPGALEMKLSEGHVITGNYKLFVSAPGFIETEKSVSFPHCVRLSYDVLLLRKKEKYRIVNGHVADDQGRSVNYISVTFTDLADKTARTVSTDFAGIFELKLKPGDYKITFPTNYYLPLKTKKFTVPADGEATFNLGLRSKQ